MGFKARAKVHEVEPPFNTDGTVLGTDKETGQVEVEWPHGRSWHRPGVLSTGAKPKGDDAPAKQGDDAGQGSGGDPT